MTRVRSSTASSRRSRVSSGRWTDSRPARVLRLVMSVSVGLRPGSRGRTWSSSAALSRRSSAWRSRSTERRSPLRSSVVVGMALSATPRARSSRASASRGAVGWGSMPRRSMAYCPCGKWGARAWAACTAKAVLPRPGCPQTTATGGWAGSRCSARVRSRSRAGPRAVKSARSRGSPSVWCGVDCVAVRPAGGLAGLAARRGRGRPRAAALSRSRAPVASSPRAVARAWTVRRCGPRERPRSMSDTARTLTPAACASSSWLSFAPVRRAYRRAANPPLLMAEIPWSARSPEPADLPAEVCQLHFCRCDFLVRSPSHGLAGHRGPGTRAGRRAPAPRSLAPSDS